MNTPLSPTDLEAQIRRTLTPEAASVKRVLSRALAEPASAKQPARWRAWVALLLVATATGAVVMWWSHERLPAESASLTITGDRGLVVAVGPDGRRWVVASGRGAAERGNFVILVER